MENIELAPYITKLRRMINLFGKMIGTIFLDVKN